MYIHTYTLSLQYSVIPLFNVKNVWNLERTTITNYKTMEIFCFLYCLARVSLGVKLVMKFAQLRINCLSVSDNVHCSDNISLYVQGTCPGGGGGGGGGALDPHFGRYVPRRSEKYGAMERLECENDGLWSGREREKVGL